MKIVISDSKTGKSYNVEIKEESKTMILGKRIGEIIDAEIVGLAGYKLEITGGSDSSGFPIRPDVYGQKKVKILLAGGVGYNPKEKGIRRKKSVRGNVISDEISQINTKVIEYGPKPLEEYFPAKKEEKK